MARNTTNTAAKATRIPADYEDFIAKASWKAMDLLEDDYTFGEAISKVVREAKWASTPDGARFIVSNSPTLASTDTASAIPDGAQLVDIAIETLMIDLRADLVDLGIEPELFA